MSTENSLHYRFTSAPDTSIVDSDLHGEADELQQIAQQSATTNMQSVRQGIQELQDMYNPTKEESPLLREGFQTPKVDDRQTLSNLVSYWYFLSMRQCIF